MTVRFLDAPGSRENNKPPIISENKTPETKSGETVKNRKEVKKKSTIERVVMKIF